MCEGQIWERKEAYFPKMLNWSIKQLVTRLCSQRTSLSTTSSVELCWCVCLVNSYTSTVRRWSLKVFRTPVRLTSNCPTVHNQVLHVEVFSRWNANRSFLFSVLYDISAYLDVFFFFFSILCNQKVKFTSECSDNAPIMTFILICVGYTNNYFYFS